MVNMYESFSIKNMGIKNGLVLALIVLLEISLVEEWIRWSAIGIVRV